VLHVGADAYADGQAVERAGAVTSAYPYDLAFFLHGVAEVEQEALLLRGGRFQVEASWRTFAGAEGPGRPVALTDESGYFWFFSSDNVELVVKVLDACTLAGFECYWVFAAGLTNVEVTLTVTDTVADEQRVYSNRMGETFEPIQDTAAFDTCGAGP